MSKREFRWKGFETKVARRVLLLFLLCAALPLATFAALGYLQVRRQLTEQSWQRLSVASKTVAMSLVERLLLLEADLVRSGLQRSEGAPLVLGEGGLWLSRGEALLSSSGAEIERRLPLDLDLNQQSTLEGGRTLLTAGRAANGLVMLRSAPDRALVWWGIINPGFLEGVTHILPDEAGLCVMGAGGRLLGCEEPAPPEMARPMPRSTAAGRISWESDGTRLGVQREVFLGSEFASDNWRVLVSEGRSVGLAPIRKFTRTFALVMLLCILLVALASDVQLNRMLGPVARLKEGTEHVSEGDLDFRVDVDTGDEFEELADSFNEMVERLGGLLDELDQLNVGTIRALASAIDAKSHWTAGHSDRVTRFSVELGQALGLDEEELEILERGAILHDVGKIAVPLSVLDKPGPLDDEEWESMRSHPVHGVRIVRSIPQYAPLLPIIGQHHERWDGSGYPDGLSGEDIDFKARIVAVADTFDAMTSDRPYRDGLPLAKALSIIEEERGSAFAPRIADAFLRLHEGKTPAGDAAVSRIDPAEASGHAEEVRKMA